MSDWDGIDEFIAVATIGSFGGGAKAIGASATHVSRSIMALEQRVQAQLFHRTTRTVRLTDTGRVFLEHCARIKQERDEAIALISERGEPRGELRVTCSTAMGERFVAPILWRYAQENPNLSITIELSNHIVDIVAEGFDLAIRTGSLTDSRLIRTRVASRTLYTCAAPDYLKKAGRLRTISDLADHECIIGTGTTWHFTMRGKEHLHRPKGRFRCNSGQAVLDACLAGIGICQLPEFYVKPYLDNGQLATVLENFRPADEPIWALYPQRRHLLPKIRNAVERLSHELKSAMNSPPASLRDNRSAPHGNA